MEETAGGGRVEAALRSVSGNARLGRAQFAAAVSALGGWAYGVAVAVYAYGADGAYGVGVVAALCWVAAAVAPAAARHMPTSARVWGGVRATAVAATAFVVAVDGPAAAVYALAVGAAAAAAVFRPAHAGLLPRLAQTPQELTAATVVSASTATATDFAGPALAALLLAATDLTATFAALAGVLVVAALAVPGIPGSEGARRETEENRVPKADSPVPAALRPIAGVLAARAIANGAVGVLVVVLALGTLELDAQAVGWLGAAAGAGGILATTALRDRLQPATRFAAGLALAGLPLLALGAWTEIALAVAVLLLHGLGNGLADDASDALLRRGVPDEALAPLERIQLGAAAVGALAAPLLVDATGIRTALLATGVLLAFVLVGAWQPLGTLARARDVPDRELALLRGVPFLAPLPAATLEQLARRLRPRRLVAGQTVFRAGDSGDRFYVVAHGAVEVRVADDGRQRPLLGDGDSFGEIALLRDVPRTATAVAAADTDLLSLERDEFVSAVTGHQASARSAGLVIGARLGSSPVA